MLETAQEMKRTPEAGEAGAELARVVGAGIPMQLAASRDLPLIGGIKVETDDVEEMLRSAEFRGG